MTSETRLLRPEGLVPYGAANAWMHELAERRLAGEIADTLVLLQHPPVYTAGRRSEPEHLRWTEERIVDAGAQLHQAYRGGSFTFHGPGQLVGYPILDLGRRPDVTAYLRKLEEIMILAARDAQVTLERSEIQTGVWSGSRKVCAIGVKLMRWRVTLHGFGLNCDTDLSWFDAIVPCGLRNSGVTSLTELAGRDVTVPEMLPLVERRFEQVFRTRLSVAAAPAA
jgi:lipoyl(octanoyl) transferase